MFRKKPPPEPKCKHAWVRVSAQTERVYQRGGDDRPLYRRTTVLMRCANCSDWKTIQLKGDWATEIMEQPPTLNIDAAIKSAKDDLGGSLV